MTIPPRPGLRRPPLAVSPAIQALEQATAAGDGDALGRFLQRLAEEGAPLIEELPGDPGHRVVTFVARERDPEQQVLLFCNRLTDVDNADEAQLMPVAVPGSDLRSRSFRMRADWRASYAIGRAGPGVPLTEQAMTFVERSLRAGSRLPRERLERWWTAQTTAQPDPFHRPDGRLGGGRGSWVELPDAPPATDLLPDPAAPKGSVRELRFGSRRLGNERPVWVYTPATASRIFEGDHGLLVMTDGEDWMEEGLITAILDRRIADGSLPPLTVVLLHALDMPTRVRELACSTDFVDAIEHELLPSLPEVAGFPRPERSIIAGLSLGGLTAAYAGLRAPHLFGHVLSMSGSFWWPNSLELGEEPAWLNRCFAAVERLPLHFHLSVGLQEQSLLPPTRHLRDVLLAKGYPVHYREFNGGHDPLCWSVSLGADLAELTAGWGRPSPDV